VRVTSSANRALATAEATTATESATPMEASSSAAMETAATTGGMGTTTAAVTTATTTTVLREGCVWGESETNKRCERYQGFEQSGSAHNLYLPYDVGARRCARSPMARSVGSNTIRF